MGLFSKKYKFTNKKISKGGVMSSLFAIGAFSCLCVGVYKSYKVDGAGGTIVGILGAAAFLLSFIGLIVGVRSFKNEEAFLGFPWFGVVSNAIVWIFMMCVILIGI
ncbi:MAG: hypothetical protein IJD58_01900 [Lachnospiraceae bacterium]|nr:hypothetical protein [Lachnospiraceae bacterium]